MAKPDARNVLVDSRLFGEVAERFKAAVLKTVEGQPSGGSNPSLSAIFLTWGGVTPPM